MPVESATAAPATTDKRTSASIADQFDDFLTLLTTQLKNQDPLSPMDSAEFTQQLVAFTGVEQSVATNQTLGAMLDLMENGTLGGAASYLGKIVDATGSQIVLPEDGTSTFRVTLPEGVAAMRVTIADADGAVVRTMEGTTTAGAHDVTWDGLNDDGRPVAGGTYHVAIDARDHAGDPVDASTRVRGTVTAAENRGGTLVLTVGDREVALSDVEVVRTADAG
ncbi:MAG: flagellar hook capping FlgD N-terminal domain-containing protein [Pseudomonadota bacterium]